MKKKRKTVVTTRDQNWKNRPSRMEAMMMRRWDEREGRDRFILSRRSEERIDCSC
jgi:hypothetical protein